MSIRKLVSVKAGVQDALDRMDSGDTRRLPVYMQWATEIDSEIGGFHSYTRQVKVINIDGCRATLPCNAVALLPGIMMGDYGCACDTVFNNFRDGFNTGVLKINTVNIFTVVDANSVSYRWNWQNYEVQDNKIIFKVSFPAGSKLTVQILGYEEDCEGFQMVSQSHLRAIARGIMWWRAEQTIFNSSELKVSYNDRGKLEKEYHRQVRKARAEDGEMTSAERAAVVNLINDAFAGTDQCYWLYGSPYALIATPSYEW